MSLSTASLLLPVFLAREFLAIKPEVALKAVISCSVYWSWGLLGLSILSGVVFQFLSAKWVRLAWEKPVGVFGLNVTESFIETGLEITFWCCALTFMVGLFFVVYFFANYAVPPAMVGQLFILGFAITG
jgi:hypothetical protein